MYAVTQHLTFDPGELRCLTVWNPYAALIRAGLKRYETRTWHTDYTGWMAVHAAARIPKDNDFEQIDRRYRVARDRMRSTGAWPLVGFSHAARTLPTYYGAIVAVARVSACVEMNTDLVHVQNPAEFAAGLWAEGNYAMKLEEVIPVMPVAMTGRQGFWTIRNRTVLTVDQSARARVAGGCFPGPLALLNETLRLSDLRRMDALRRTADRKPENIAGSV